MGSGTIILIQIIGAVILLLWGIRMVRTGFERYLGADLRHFFARATGNRFKAVVVGAGLAVALQSSTAVVIMATGFASRGALTIIPGLAFILGADVGTAIAAQLLSFKISALSPILLTLGYILFSGAKGIKRKNAGRMFIGLGLVFMALQLIGNNAIEIGSSDLLSTLIMTFKNDIPMALLFMIIMTWVLHSSLAVVLFVVALVSTGTLPVELGYVFVIGANIGSAIPAILLTASQGHSAKRLAYGNALFRISGALIFLPLVGYIQTILTSYNIEIAQSVIIFHIIFNVSLVILFIPLLKFMMKILESIIPVQNLEAGDEQIQPIYLKDGYETPSKSIANVAREAKRIADIVYEILDIKHDAYDEKGTRSFVSERNNQVQILRNKTILYLSNISNENLSQAESTRILDIFNFTTNLGHMANILDQNIADHALKRGKNKVEFSSEGKEELLDLHRALVNNFQIALDLFMSQDQELARELLVAKNSFRELVEEATNNHIERLRNNIDLSITSSFDHLDTLRDFRRLNSHISVVAYPLISN